jgi:opacity protein-like surface antigen
MMWIRLLILAIAIPSAIQAQIAPYLEVTAFRGSLERPYAGRCTQGDGRIGGLAVDAGARRGAYTLSVGFSSGSQIDRSVCALEPFVPAEDGTYPFAGYVRSRNDGVAIVRARIGYSPSILRHATLYGGGGWETADKDLVLTTGLAIHTTGRLRVVGGVEWTHFRTTYRYSEGEWRGGVQVQSTMLGEEHHWKSSFGLWAGVQVYPLAWIRDHRPPVRVHMSTAPPAARVP